MRDGGGYFSNSALKDATSVSPPAPGSLQGGVAPPWLSEMESTGFSFLQGL